MIYRAKHRHVAQNAMNHAGSEENVVVGWQLSSISRIKFLCINFSLGRYDIFEGLIGKGSVRGGNPKAPPWRCTPCQNSSTATHPGKRQRRTRPT